MVHAADNSGESHAGVSLAVMTILDYSGSIGNAGSVAIGTGHRHRVVRGVDLCHVLSEKVLGLGDLAVPLLKLVRTEKVDCTLANLVTMC